MALARLGYTPRTQVFHWVDQHTKGCADVAEALLLVTRWMSFHHTDGVDKNHYYSQQFRSVHQWLRKWACILKADDAISFLKPLDMLKKKPCLFHQSCLRKTQKSWSNCPSLKPALVDYIMSVPFLHAAQRHTWEPSKVAFSAFAENWDKIMATCLPQEDSFSELGKQFHELFRRESLFTQLKSTFPHRVMFNSYRIHILSRECVKWFISFVFFLFISLSSCFSGASDWMMLIAHS